MGWYGRQCHVFAIEVVFLLDFAQTFHRESLQNCDHPTERDEDDKMRRTKNTQKKRQKDREFFNGFHRAQ